MTPNTKKILGFAAAVVAIIIVVSLLFGWAHCGNTELREKLDKQEKAKYELKK